MLSQLTQHAKRLGARLSVAATRLWRRLMRPAHPRANAICERFVGSLRRECLDHVLVIGELQLVRVLMEYVAYFNPARPHQGIAQKIPTPTVSPPSAAKAGKVLAFPVLNGLHHD